MRYFPLTAALLGQTLLATVAIAQAGPQIDLPFGPGMVIQRDRPVPIHGHATAGATVIIGFDGQTIKAPVGADGAWRASLPAHGAGGPFRLTVADQTGAVSLDDILVGDVWLCSGQSNMEFTLRHATNADTEVAQSDHPRLRLLNVPRQSSATPQDRFSAPTRWAASSPASTPDFSAACYFMGRDLAAHQGIPVGLIAASWGGSVIEDWLSRPALQTVPRYHPDLALLDRYATDPAGAMQAWGDGLVSWLGPHLGAAAGAAWRPVPKLTFWEDWGGDTAFFDGIGYYRAKITLRPDQVAAASLVIGAADDMDVTRINGTVIGSGQGWNTERRYGVPAGLLHAGDNLVEVTVVDTGGGGGIWGATPHLDLGTAGKIEWHDAEFSLGAPLSATGAPGGVPWIGGSGRTTLFNGMIAPLRDFPVQGFAWYQGEANVGDPQGYHTLMAKLAADWRTRMGGQAFIMVQLANFGALADQPRDDAWGRFRDAQRQIADADPLIGLASAIDVGQPGDIHPTNKQDVGHRLALEARRLALHEPVTGRGPDPVSAERSAAGVTVRFANGPLRLIGGGVAIGFELCDAKALCHWAEGRVAGDSVTLPADPAAVTVRHAWAASPVINLFSASGLPTGSFEIAIKQAE